MKSGKLGWSDYRKTMFFSGIPLILAGIFIVLYVFAFMSMINDRLEADKWWRELVSKYLQSKDALLGTLFGLFFIAAGLLMCVKAFARQKHSDGG